MNLIFNGKPVLIEAGTPGYSDPVYKSYYRSVAGHNVLQVGDNVNIGKGIATLTHTNITETSGEVTMRTGLAAGMAYYPVEWSRNVSWQCSSANRVAVQDGVKLESLQNVTFRWHLATEVEPEIRTENGAIKIHVPAGEMKLGAELYTSPEINLQISASTEISINSVPAFDHTLKYRIPRHQHRVIEITTKRAVKEFSMETVISD
ncbi:MAG: heparinase II/III family protein [Kiritimatiellales bacterium]